MKLRKAILICGTVIINSGICVAQAKQTDSLKQILAIAKEDTNKIKTLNELGIIAANKNEFENASQYGKEALALSERLDFDKGKAASHHTIGINQVYQNLYPEAITSFREALRINEKLGDKIGIAQHYKDMALVYYIQENDPEALKNYYIALRLYEQLKDSSAMADALHEIGATYYYLQNYTEAEKNYKAALKIYQMLGSNDGIAYATKNIGVLYTIQGKEAFKKGETGIAKTKYNEAIEMHQTAIRIFEKSDSKNGLMETFPFLGNTYEMLGYLYLQEQDTKASEKSYSLALDYDLAFMRIAEELNDHNYINEACNVLGSIYIKLKKYNEANFFLKKGLAIAIEKGYVSTRRDVYEHLAVLDSCTGNFKGALKHYKLFIQFRDSLINTENTREAEQHKLQFEFDKKEDSLNQKQIITQTKLESQKNQKNFYLAGAGMLGLLSLFVFLNFRNQKKINRLADDAHAKEKAELELQSLRAQLNPHFMFNSLNAIQELILLEENEKSQSYLARFAKLLRMLLENADRPFIPLQREIDFLQLYLSLENLRIPDLEFSITVDPKINTEETQIPNMILQPYIENAIWHGLSHKESDKRLAIRINNENGFTKYEIEDNGVGRKRSAELKSLYRKEHKSKGMELLSKRFKLLAKEYGSDIETMITDVMEGNTIKGTLITIKVPVEFSNNKRK
jgi:tetratricopeptide (TPR) repeat protein